MNFVPNILRILEYSKNFVFTLLLVFAMNTKYYGL
jgi:hypothetical protein